MDKSKRAKPTTKATTQPTKQAATKQSEQPENGTTQKKRAKTGGRVAGTPNKVTSLSKTVISNLLNDYQSTGLMYQDFLAIEPKDRMQIAERLMQYVMPRMQATQVDINTQDTQMTIERKLIERSKDPNEKD